MTVKKSEKQCFTSLGLSISEDSIVITCFVFLST